MTKQTLKSAFDRDQLLLFNYFIYAWYDQESKFDPKLKLETFLIRNPRSLYNRILYLTCVASSVNGGIGLLKLFTEWLPYSNGPVCDYVYHSQHLLYTFDLKESKFTRHLFVPLKTQPLGSSEELDHNQIKDVFNYKDLRQMGIETDDQFRQVMERNFASQCELIKTSLKVLFNSRLVGYIMCRNIDFFNELCSKGAYQSRLKPAGHDHYGQTRYTIDWRPLELTPTVLAHEREILMAYL